jgi:hypothetical protein
MVLKVIVFIQVALVILKKQTTDSKLYIVSDTIFKISIALYLFIFFIVNKFPGLDFEDTILLRFAGVILLYDIDYSGLIKIVREYYPGLPKVPFLEATSD